MGSGCKRQRVPGIARWRWGLRVAAILKSYPQKFMKPVCVLLPVLSLGAVLTMATGQGQGDKFKIPDDQAAKIKAALPAKTPAPVQKKHEVLVFSKTAGFRHSSIAAGVYCMKALGEKTGLFNVTHTEDEAWFAPDKLKAFDAVIMVNTTGEIFKGSPLGEDVLKASLVNFVKSGKGLVGMHSATDTYSSDNPQLKWKEYNDMMGGAFESHPWGSGDTVKVRNLEPGHPLNAAFNAGGITLQDEIYKFRPTTAQPTERRMLLALDPSGTDMKKDDGNKDGMADRNFYPIAWLSKYGEGRTFYCSLGHNEHIYWTPEVVAHYLAGIQYALGELPADAAPKAVAMVLSDGTVVARQ